MWTRTSTIALAIITAGVTGLAASPAGAQCGGLCPYEVGTPDNGVSAAGAGARAQDAATSYWNPAGMTRLEGTHLMAGSVIAYGSLRFRGDSTGDPFGGGNGGRAGGFAPLAGSYTVTDLPSKLVDGLRFGFSFNGLYGGSTTYDKDWAGRAFVTENELFALNLQFSLAYPVLDWLSIGVGGSAIYTRFTQQWNASLSQATPANPTGGSPAITIQGSDDWAGNAFVGVLVEPCEETRLGLTYRSKTDTRLEGRVDIPFPQDADLTIEWTWPQGVNLSIYHQATDRLALLGDAGWSDWSVFGAQSFGISAFGQDTDVIIDRDWHDTWRLGAGTRYQLLDSLLVMGGFSYDSSPVDADRRTPDIPVGEGYRFSFGTEYRPIEALLISLTYTFNWLGKMEVDNVTLPGSVPVTLDGEYNPSSIHFIGIVVGGNF